MRQGTLDVIYGAVMFAVGALLFWASTDPRYVAMPGMGAGSNPMFFPRILLALWMLLALLIAARGLLARGEPVPRQRWAQVGLVLALVAGYTWLITAVGFLLASVLLCLALMLALGYRRLVVVGAVTVLLPTVIWYVFEFVLKIPLPTSPWFDRL